jgi:hypothetical protein
MFRNFLNEIININSTANIISITAAIGVAIVLGGIIFLTYKLTSDEFSFDKDIGLVMFLIPVIVALMISVIGTNVATAFGIAGVLALVRYRSVVIKPKDLVCIFFGMGAGFTAGVGHYLSALIFVVITCIILAVYTACSSGKKKNQKKILKVAVPENIDYDGLFDETLGKYTNAYNLKSIRIISGGTVTELTYAVRIKDMTEVKEFIDELRTLNANFKIQLKEYAAEE